MSELISQSPVMFWLVVAAAAGVFEAVAVGLVSVWFSVGALVAAVPAALGASFLIQAAVFLAASVASMILTRPFLKNILRVKETPTNADRVIGRAGVVVSAIDNLLETGRVRADGLDWEARSADGSRIEENAVVVVKELRGVKVIVEKTADGENKGENKKEEN